MMVAVPGDAPDDGPLLQRGVALGRFLLLDPLGEGAMGVVWSAYDPELDRRVAVKLLRPATELRDDAAAARMVREAQALARVAHPNVVTVYEVGNVGARVFVVMELIAGQTLAAWLAAGERSWREILTVLVAAGRGLAAAHAAGLVHRDFKPENVLVGADGRARVVDFGLVGLLAPEPVSDPEPEPGPELAAGDGRDGDDPGGLTRTGALVGTPRYMAPEQHARRPATARSDQFAFCVALWSALAGEPPYPVDSYRELVRAVRDGRRRPPPRDARMPAHVRRALERGLAPEPSVRFPDMTALLDQLERDPAATRRRWVAGVVGASVVAGGVALALARSPTPAAGRDRELLCRGGEARLDALAPRATLDRAVAALAAVGLPRGVAIAEAVRARLDAYASAWLAQRGEACAATRLLGEQSEAVMDLRMTCLDRRGRELGALAAEIERVTPAELDRMVQATYRLTPLASCEDVAALQAPLPPPTDAAARAEVDAVAGEVARVRALLDTGRFAQAIEAGRALRPRAEATAHRPTLAELLQALGDAEAQAGEIAAARTTLEAAAWAAEAGRHDAVAARAWTVLAFVAGYLGSDVDDGLRAARRADAAILRINDPPEARGRLELNLGAIAYGRGDGPKALAHWLDARRRWEQALGSAHPDVARVLTNLGTAYGDLGRSHDAVAAYQQAIAIGTASIGDRHPLVGAARHNLGVQLLWNGDPRAAEVELRRALDSLDETLGPAHSTALATVADLAAALLELDGLDEAWRLLERARAGQEAGGGVHPATLCFQAEILRRRGQLAEARDRADQALAIVRAGESGGPRWMPAGTALAALAAIEIDARRFAVAEAHAQAAVEDLARTFPADSPWLAAPLVLLAEARLGRGRHALAAAAVERAATILAPGHHPRIEAHAARVRAALAAAAGQPEQARLVLDQAHAALVADGLGETEAARALIAARAALR